MLVKMSSISLRISGKIRELFPEMVLESCLEISVVTLVPSFCFLSF